ncbi:MAG: hypothetical protein M1818_005703 [Claussenomyces sp. TS43310]|nr:MAG: hypothetical protein M1818_005703 [Claussenomyces sp. TS43310]
MLLQKGDTAATPILTKPIKQSGRIQTPRGSIDQSRLIGRGIRDVVSTNKKVEYRIHQPSLAEYVTLSPRIVTPIYPADANLIVSLLDLHPEVPTPDENDTKLEIFEAGTGHGALTLHLARAIHGANPPAPSLPTTPSSQGPLAEPSPKCMVKPELPTSEPVLDGPSTTPPDDAAEKEYGRYLSTRRAVINTLDISASNTSHARHVVRSFRHGIYYHNIDFHVGTIPDYISSRLEISPVPFLDHAILDLPSPHSYLDVVGQALKPNGSVVVFCPSITQINSCVLRVKEKKLPLLLETVLEVGAGVGVGGREWDVRPVKPRALVKAEAVARRNMVDGGESDPESDINEETSSAAEGKEASSGWEMVCRPKVGGRVSGGGFLGLFRSMVQY